MLKSLKRNTILVIEDEDDVRNFVCRVLELEGFITLESEDGLTGLKLTKEKRVAIVLLDLHLPYYSGWEVLQNMKADPALSSIPVLVLTASAAVTQKEKALAMGAQKYLVKPLSAKTLRQAVVGALRGGEVSCR